VYISGSQGSLLGEEVASWLNDDGARSPIFEFSTSGRFVLGRSVVVIFVDVVFFSENYDGVQMVASKVYQRGVVMLIMYHENSYFVSMMECVGDQPLLDTYVARGIAVITAV
jgi:hypothetical protein